MQARDIFGLEGLADLGARNGVDMRPTLLRVLTDLYVHRLSHTASEERHYTELALRLLDTVDVPTRAAVAKRFARYPSPPLRVLQWLTRDLPEVAAELRAHPLLQPPTRTDAVPAISAAAPIAETAAITRHERRSAWSLVVDRATAHELCEQFFAATAQERRLILLNLDIVAPIAADRIRIARDPSISQRLEAAALAGKREDFAHQLAGALHIPREFARRIGRDELGEPVVIAGKALGMPREVLYRILMFVNPTVGHSVERVHALAALYDEMSLPAAVGMLAVWQALEPAEQLQARYRSLTWDEERRRHWRPAMTSVQHGPPIPRVVERRNAS